MAYDENSIRILDAQESQEKFLFAKKVELLRLYPTNSQEFIHRLVDACVLSGTPIEKAVSRYLDGDKSAEVPEELFACFKNSIRAHQGGQS